MDRDAKKVAAEKAVTLVRDGMVVGLGSGSTSALAIELLGEKVRNGLKILAVPSSLKSASLAKTFSIPLVESFDTDLTIDIAIDGADEVDTRANLLKGGGGSLLREKIIAYASKRFHVMVDETKLVQNLGAFPLPVEIVPFSRNMTIKHIRALECDPALRTYAGNPFVTDNGNYIVDCKFAQISDPAWLDVKLKMIPGVVETGLFSGRVVTSVFVGYRHGEVKEIKNNT